MAEVVEARTAFGATAPASPSRKRSASPSPTDEPATALTTAASTDVTTTEPPAKKTKLIRRKRRPARPQIDPSALKSTGDPPPQTGTVFNIWYNKWAGGDREDAALSKTAAINRCHVKEDAGWTTADKVSGSYFCLFFARGICPKGHECQYLHRLPGMFDHFNPNVDVFGRDKHSDYRDDMGGVGSFLRQNRTLYVGRIHVTDDIEEIVARHFAEWGEVERIRVLTGRGVAFITYVHEGNAQFAKEAMAHQALDNTEILNVRWATVDPNPLSQKREVQRIEEQAAEAVRKALGERAVKQIEGRETREEIEQRRIESGFGLEGYEAPDDVWYNAQKQRETAGQQRQLEDASAGEVEGEHQVRQASNGNTVHEAAEGGGGFFGASTLAALKDRSGVSKAAPSVAPAPVATSALVGYGSDSD